MSKRLKRMKNEYSIAFSLRPNRLPAPKTGSLEQEPYLPVPQYGLGIACRP
jgi:hypothetical protein